MIPAGRKPAVMQAIASERAPLWVKRAEDGTITSNSYPDESWAGDGHLEVLMSPDGELVLSLEEAASSNLHIVGSGAGGELRLPMRVERRQLTDIEVEKAGNVTTTTYRGVVTHDYIVFESSRSNLENAWKRTQPNRTVGIVWAGLGAGLGLGSLLVLKRSSEVPSADTQSGARKIAGTAGALSLTAIALGAYMLLAPGSLTPLR
jgi:hypothetical protein